MAAGDAGSYVSYRGEENRWGNIWDRTDGMNLYTPSPWEGTVSGGQLYVADDNFSDDTDEAPYYNTGINIVRMNGEYISAFGYTPEYDWLFIGVEDNGSSSNPVGDPFQDVLTGWAASMLGGRWNGGSSAGGFYWNFNYTASDSIRYHGGRVCYIPTKNR